MKRLALLIAITLGGAISLLLGFPETANAYWGRIQGAELTHCTSETCIQISAAEMDSDVTGKVFSTGTATLKIRAPGMKDWREVNVSEATLFLSGDFVVWTDMQGTESWLNLVNHK
ncbi:MAG: hypothetical protein NDI61_00755 [Bdellovibrionaceae bacterium]|nr:hypothetical protein [Pseudobdellovibrionaceae bacterium]